MNDTRSRIASIPAGAPLSRLPQCPPCHGQCHQGRRCNAESCAPEGGTHADPVPSGTHRNSWLSRAWLWLARALG